MFEIKQSIFFGIQVAFLKKSGIILAFFGCMRGFLVALINASFTSIIEKGLVGGVKWIGGVKTRLHF